MNEKIENRNYINPLSDEICKFTKKMKKDTNSLEGVIHNIFQWFDENVKYSRIEQPYYPLQRNDLELLKMKAGTCGDYSNLIVSVLINIGVPAKYGYLKRDCYGDEQDHICAAAEVNGKWILIDATMPYRKWYGFDCPHKEYDLYDPQEFETIMKKEEDVFYTKALNWGNEKFAGLLYAPWIYNETIINTDDNLESVFYLLIFENKSDWTLWISYIVYTKNKGFIPMMIRINQNLKRIFLFSVNEPDSLWDGNQWSVEYSLDEIPESMKLEYFYRCLKNIDDNMEKIKGIIQDI